MNECKVYLNKGEDERIRRGHVWVYSNEVNRITGPIESGNLSDVYTFSGDYLGQGFLNTASKIFVRILSRNPDDVIDNVFFRKRLEAAKAHREDAGLTDTYRACFGEADGIPGLIVDKYSDYLSVQFLTLGTDKRKADFVQLLNDIYNPKGIYERSDVKAREKEGLEQIKNLLLGVVPDRVMIKEGNIKLYVDIKNGQKTGTYLDQRNNHLSIIPFVKDKSVLDCFSHDGNFALQAKLAGACRATAVDISQDACQRISDNAKLNNLDIDIVKSDVFEYLRMANRQKAKYDVIILDPPAFAKKKSDVEQASKGYKEINMQAMDLLNDGGYLVTSSCSHYLELNHFLDILAEAAADRKKNVQMVKLSLQNSDHPVLLGSDETMYLKFLILRILSY